MASDKPTAPRDRAAKGFGATDPRIAPYVERLLEPEDAVLHEIRERSTREGLPPIAVGPFDGRHLEVLARMAGARRIVEIGTLGGYSGVCLARALPPGGLLDMFEIDPHHARVAAESFAKAGVADRVRIHVGPALERLKDIEREGPFDLVFLDADKAGYPAYLEWAERHLRVGGVVVADNVFRRAAFPLEGDDPRSADGIRRFNEALARSGRFRATMLPLEDGFAVGVRIAPGRRTSFLGRRRQDLAELAGGGARERAEELRHHEQVLGEVRHAAVLVGEREADRVDRRAAVVRPGANAR